MNKMYEWFNPQAKSVEEQEQIDKFCSKFSNVELVVYAIIVIGAYLTIMSYLI